MQYLSVSKCILVLSMLFSISCSSNSDEPEIREKEDVAMTDGEEAPQPEPEIENERESIEETEENAPNPQNSVVAEYGQLSVSGKHMVDKNGNAVQLRGMSLFWSQWRDQYYTKEAVKWLKEDWNVTIIRASMGIEDSDGYLTHKAKEKAKIFEVIDAAIAEEIYVVVDWHSHHAEDHIADAKEFFGEVAQKYGNNPNIIYETYNEPLDVSWSGVLKPYHEEVIAEIRKYDPDNIVVCGTRTWSQRVDEVVGNEIEDNNVMYTLHYYSSSHKEDLRGLAQTAIDNDIPLFVTEFGVTEYTGDGQIDVASANTWWNFLDENKISWCNWSIADKAESSAALRPGANGKGGWPESQITPSGLMVRTELKAKNPKF